MSKPHILIWVIYWAGQLTSGSARFEDGIAAAAAGEEIKNDLTRPTCLVEWWIFPEKT